MNQYRELIHGGDLATLQGQFPGQSFLDFSANINPLGQPQSVQIALQGCASACQRYPDALCRELTTAIARYEAVLPDAVLCGNGAVDIIYRIAFGLRPKNALLLAPTFAEYEQALVVAGCAVQHHILACESGFALDDTILPKIGGNDILFLCNPNNPTGSLIPKPLLLRILERCRECGCMLVVDECFLDFLPDEPVHSLKDCLTTAKNLIILRAFTKMFAIPGVRLGYGLLSDETTHLILERVAPAWSVSTPAQLCGIAAAAEREFVQKTQQLILTERKWLYEQLKSLGLRVYSGSANFLLFYTQQKKLAQNLCNRGIIIRDCSNYFGLTKGYFRVAVRLRQQNEALITAIKKELVECRA